MSPDNKTTDPILLAEAVGNNRWRYFVLNVTIDAESKEEADDLILEAKEVLDAAVEKSEGVWRYEEIGVTISAATKEDADKRAMDYFLRNKERGIEGEKEEK